MTAPPRAALYTAEGSTLIACARHAERAGFRVVTMVDEDQPNVGLAGAGLDALVDRLGKGEFEVIVADVGDGRVVTIAGVSPEAAAEVPSEVMAKGSNVRCAIYVRCATVSQAMPYPLADQWNVCEAYAVQQGWETIAVYKDNTASGLKGSRPGLDAMMAQAGRGTFDVVLLQDVSRLSRDVAHLHALIQEMESLGVTIHTVAGGPISQMEMAFRSIIFESMSALAAKVRRSSRQARTDAAA